MELDGILKSKEEMKNKMLDLHKEIYNVLLKLMDDKNLPNFYFLGRKKPLNQIKEGLIFQGKITNNYVCFSFYSLVSQLRKIFQLGMIFERKIDRNNVEKLLFKFTIQANYGYDNKSGNNDNEKGRLEIEIIRPVIKEVLEKIFNVTYADVNKSYTPIILEIESIEDTIRNFLNTYFLRINEIIERHKTEKIFFITNDEFQKWKSKIEKVYNPIDMRLNSIKKQIDVNNRVDNSSLPLNHILFGPPGTGKTFTTKQKAIDILNEKREDPKLNRNDFQKYLIDFTKENSPGQIAFTTFHQSMTYEDFIEGIKPVINEEDKNNNEGEVKYKIEPGIFKRMCDRAKDNPTNNYVLIIDEINRGDVSKIFGELITLIEEDKRVNVRPEVDKKEYETIQVTLPYSKKPFTVPNNLYILGTMNTADRSVEALDTALRRRFSFEELMPKDELKELENEVFGYQLKDILNTINQRIEVLLDRDHQIGHSYFLEIANKSNEQEVNPKIFLDALYNKIIPLLQEYFYNDYEKIAMILGSKFVEVKSKIEFFADNKSIVSTDYNDKPLYTVVQKEKISLQDALDNLMNKSKNPNPTANTDGKS